MSIEEMQKSQGILAETLSRMMPEQRHAQSATGLEDRAETAPNVSRSGERCRNPDFLFLDASARGSVHLLSLDTKDPSIMARSKDNPDHANSRAFRHAESIGMCSSDARGQPVLRARGQGSYWLLKICDQVAGAPEHGGEAFTQHKETDGFDFS
ncbi:MAG: hypothetical protein OXC91_00485 [Rhodobacteraceae bacterium]|nr:hypothetical protein [Paracoccaceae bacterium]